MSTPATNSALGEIKLAGDLAGSNDATAPELTTVLSSPGAYGIAKPTIDAKGRVTAITNASPSDVVALFPDASITQKGVVKIGTNISINSTAAAGYQTIDFGGVLTATTLTGLCSNGATYSFKLLRDGVGPIKVEVTASALTQVQDLINAVNAIITPFSLVLVSGNLQVTSNTTGVTSSVLISEDNLFQFMMNYVEIDPAVPGMGDATIYIPDATVSVKGVAKFKSTDFTVSGGSVSMKPLADATTSSKGVVQVGTGLGVTGGVLSLNMPDATTSSKGVIQVGTNLTVTGGVLSAPTATTSVKGAVQVGTNLTVTGGVLSANDATTSSKGVIQVGTNLTVTGGVLNVPLATTSTAGAVQVGAGLAVDGAGLLTLSSPLATASSSVFGVVKIGAGLTSTGGVISVDPLPDATTSSKGLVQIGANLAVSGGIVSASFPDATTSVKGLVQVGAGLEVSGGVLSLAAVPDATTSSKGYMQVGEGLAVSGGVVSANIPDATASVKGLVQVGAGLAVSGGVLSSNAANDATTSSKGIVQVGTNLTVSGGVLSAAYPDATSSVPGLVTIGAGLVSTGGVVDINIPDASTTVKGLVQVGANLIVSSGSISAAVGTDSSFGVVKSNNTANITITSGLIDVGTNIPKLNAANTFTKAQVTALVQAGTYGVGNASFTPDFSAGNVFSITANGSFNLLAPTNVVAGGTYLIIVYHSSSDNSCYFGSSYKFPTNGLTVVSKTAGKTDIISITALSSSEFLTTLQVGF